MSVGSGRKRFSLLREFAVARKFAVIWGISPSYDYRGGFYRSDQGYMTTGRCVMIWARTPKDLTPGDLAIGRHGYWVCKDSIFSHNLG